MTTSTRSRAEIGISAADLLAARRLPGPKERIAIREAAGLSVPELAAAIGVLPITVTRWERGESRPQFRHALLYSRLLSGLSGTDSSQK